MTGAARASGPVVIRHGIVQVVNDFGALVYYKQDLLKHYGKSYTLELIHFAGTSQQLTALASGDIDVMTIAFSSLGAAIQNARMTDLRVIADGLRDGVGNHASSPYFVRAESNINTIEDIKGKIMVVNQIGSAVDIGARAMLRQHKLEAAKDYTVLEAPFPTMAAILLQNKADLIATTPPFSYDARLNGKTKLLFDLKQSMGETEMIVEASRDPFLKSSRAAMVDYLEDVVRFTHWILDPANRKAAVAMAADVAKQPIDQMDSYYLTDKDVYHALDTIPDLGVLQNNINTQQSLGFIKNPIDVKKYSDLSLVIEAAKRYDVNP
jgi:sulfonate transport system substrate-binding protein